MWDFRGENKREKKALDWLDEQKYITLFIDGNHECHPRLAEYPLKDFAGGKVHQIRPHVLHLVRGEYYDIAGTTFWCMGGASSHDIQSGIMPFEVAMDEDQRQEWLDTHGPRYRVEGISWWPAELPSTEELRHGEDTLVGHNYTVDYIITHCPPASIIGSIGHGRYKQDRLTEYLEDISQKTKFKHWFCGHMHFDYDFGSLESDDDIYKKKLTVLYDWIERIA